MTRPALIDFLIIAIACGWLLLFAHNGLSAHFSNDDLMNLHGHLSRPATSLLVDNLRYWSTSYRPLGGLFYITLYRFFGFDPLPFRVACFVLLALNLGLLARFTFRLSESREVAFLALLCAGYHAWFVDLYYSTGTVYDLLCYAFFFGAFNVHLGIRARGRIPAWGCVAALSILYVCALNAKEMAVSLPVLLGIYELIYHGQAFQRSYFRWLWREGRVVAVTGILTIPYVIGKLLGTGSLVENPAYGLTISSGRYLDTFHLYLNPLFYQEHVFHDANTVQLLLAMLALALWRRSRPLIFAWCFVLISLLPVAFIGHYSGFFLYLPMAGWSLYAGVLLVMVRRLASRLLKRLVSARPALLRLESAPKALVPVLLVLFLAPQHWRESAKTLEIFQSAQPPSRQVAEELIALQPSLPRGARVLFVGDPCPKDEYFLLFLTRLLYHDMSITVEKESPGQNSRLGQDCYDVVFEFRDGHLVAADRSS